MWRGLCAALIAIPVVLACGATPTIVTQAPASAVSVNVVIRDQYAATPQIQVAAFVHVAGHAGLYNLSTAHTLTCDGVPLPLTSAINPTEVAHFEAISALVPRQPPGSAYIFVYTDEHRQRTSLAVPVPRGTFAVTAPTEGASIKVPQQPTFAATPTIAGTPNTGNLDSTSVVSTPMTPTPADQKRDPSQVSQPPVLIHYTMPVIPANASATFQATAMCNGVGGGICGDIRGPIVDATGLYALTDMGETIGYGFEEISQYVPNSGSLMVTFAMEWRLPPNGFDDASVNFTETRTIPVVWTR